MVSNMDTGNPGLRAEDSSSSTHSPLSEEKDDIEALKHAGHAASKLALSEEEILARARANPAETLPVSLTFAPDDKGQPTYYLFREYARRRHVCSSLCSLLDCGH